MTLLLNRLKLAPYTDHQCVISCQSACIHKWCWNTPVRCKKSERIQKKMLKLTQWLKWLPCFWAPSLTVCTGRQAQGDYGDEQQTRHFLSWPFSLKTEKYLAFAQEEIFTKNKILTWTPFLSLLLLIFNHLTVPSFCLPWSSSRLWCYWKSLGSSEVQTSAFYCCLARLKPHPRPSAHHHSQP